MTPTTRSRTQTIRPTWRCVDGRRCENCGQVLTAHIYQRFCPTPNLSDAQILAVFEEAAKRVAREATWFDGEQLCQHKRETGKTCRNAIISANLWCGHCLADVLRRVSPSRIPAAMYELSTSFEGPFLAYGRCIHQRVYSCREAYPDDGGPPSDRWCGFCNGFAHGKVLVVE